MSRAPANGVCAVAGRFSGQTLLVLAVLVCAAGALELVFALGGPLLLTPDSVGYLQDSRTLLHGGFALFPVPASHGLGYPVLLAWVVGLFGEGAPLALKLLQHGAALGIRVMVFALAWRLTGSALYAALAVLLNCTFIQTLVLANTVLTETAYAACVTASCLCLVLAVQSRAGRWRIPALWFCASMALCAASAWLRPQGKLLLAVPLLVGALAFLRPAPGLRRALPRGAAILGLGLGVAFLCLLPQPRPAPILAFPDLPPPQRQSLAKDVSGWLWLKLYYLEGLEPDGPGSREFLAQADVYFREHPELADKGWRWTQNALAVLVRGQHLSVDEATDWMHGQVLHTIRRDPWGFARLNARQFAMNLVTTGGEPPYAHNAARYAESFPKVREVGGLYERVRQTATVLGTHVPPGYFRLGRETDAGWLTRAYLGAYMALYKYRNALLFLVLFAPGLVLALRRRDVAWAAPFLYFAFHVSLWFLNPDARYYVPADGMANLFHALPLWAAILWLRGGTGEAFCGQPEARPRRVVLVISSLALGGAERTLGLLAGGLARRGHEVHILSFDKPDAAPFFPLPPGVRLSGLDLNRPARSLVDGLRQNARRVAVLRRRFRELRPEVAVGFMDMTNVLCILAGLGQGVPVLATEHTDPGRHEIGPVWRALRRLTYPLAAAVTAQTEAVCRLLPGRCVVLPNPVESPAEGESAPPLGLPAGRVLLALGRLAPEKGFDLLLTAFADLAPSRPHWSLVILGEGPERPRLEAQRRRLGLEGRTHLPGAVADPSAWLRRAKLFVLSSRYEGFSNALCEAQAWGVPAVAFDCESGPAEILRHGVSGLLVPPGDVPALAASLARLMDDEALRRSMAARAPEVVQRFGLEKVLDLWEALFGRVLAGGAGKQRPATASGLRAALSHAGQMLRKSGPAPDSPFFLRLLEREGRLKTFLLRFLRLRVSPDALPRMRALAAPLDERARLFRQAVSLLNVNETYKTTGSDRTRLADETILGLIPVLASEMSDAAPLRILDIGVSDGSASVALLTRLPRNSEAILTDLHPVLYARGPGFFRVFLDGQRRLLGVKVLGLYCNLSLGARRETTGFETIDTLNPLLAERLGMAAIRPFDALKDVLAQPVQLIKCANVLNRGYFSDAALLAAAANLGRSLVEGGFLVVSQNNARYRDGEACFVLRKRGQRLLLAGQANGHAALPLFAGDTVPKEDGPCASS